MTEIELKARVKDPKSLALLMNKKASFSFSVIRDDSYWKKDNLSIRIREEKFSNGKKDILVTYKRKEIRKEKDGSSIEVNDEKECTVSSSSALEEFLSDNGYSVQLKKHKEVTDWTLKLAPGDPLKEEGEATFELCYVPPLGYFLEIEILSSENSEDVISKAHKKLEELLVFAGLKKEDIEPRYYSELLRETEEK